MDGGLLYGPLVGADGCRQRARIGRLRLRLLWEGDRSTLRAELPGALASARAGDSAPLLRLALRSERGIGPSFEQSMSEALYAVTTCEEWTASMGLATPFDARRPSAEAAVRALPAPLIAPFDRAAALFWSTPFQLCARWPNALADPQLPYGLFPRS